MSKTVRINEKITTYSNELEKKAFVLIKDQIDKKLAEIDSLSIFTDDKYICKPEGKIPVGNIEIIGGITGDRAENIKKTINEIRELINKSHIN